MKSIIISIAFVLVLIVLVIMREESSSTSDNNEDISVNTTDHQHINNNDSPCNNCTDTTHQHNINPFYHGEVIDVKHGGGYTYLEVKEHSGLSFWIALDRIEVNKGDVVRFQKELVAKNFTSEALNKTFDELMFASNLQYRVSE